MFYEQIELHDSLLPKYHQSCNAQFQDLKLLQDNLDVTVCLKISFVMEKLLSQKSDIHNHNKEHQVEMQPSDAPSNHIHQK